MDNLGITRWFNPAAFKAPGQFNFGDSGRNILFEPGQWNLNTSLVKEFRAGELATIQFRGEAFNMPNHASFGNPAASLNNASTLGRISSTSVAARAVQFALRVTF